MLGRVLETFDDVTLGRFLTSKMAPGKYVSDDDSRCFVGIAVPGIEHANEFPGVTKSVECVRREDAIRTRMSVIPSKYFDALCARFGTARVAQAIRTRALTILLRRGRSVESLVSSQHSTRAAHEGATL